MALGIEKMLPPMALETVPPPFEGPFRILSCHAQTMLELAVDVSQVVRKAAGHQMKIADPVKLQPVTIPFAQQFAQMAVEFETGIKIWRQIMPITKVDTIKRNDRRPQPWQNLGNFV